MFGPLSLVLISLLFFAVTYGIYRRDSSDRTSSPPPALALNYIPWLLSRSGHTLGNLVSRSEGRLVRTWRGLPVPAFDKGLLGSLGLCWLYLTVSGFLSVWWPGRALHGLFLVLHMVFGGAFAVVVAAGVFRWARHFLVRGKSGDRPGGQRFLFWFFSWSGALLIFSALGMMLPLFASFDQPVLLAVHRYSALVSVLSGVLLSDRLIREADDAGS